jgi:6-phosphogluconolactonase (cycloisomerase 2 family)
MTEKYFDVVAVHPITKRETTFCEVPACHLRQNESGETLFTYNYHFDSVEVIKVTEVPEQRLINLSADYATQADNEYPDL